MYSSTIVIWLRANTITKRYYSKKWWLPWGTSVLQCSLHDYYSRYDFTYVFSSCFTESSNIAELYVNPATSEVIVEYKSGGTYSYTNVNKVAIDDFLYTRANLSLGQWVNKNLAQNPAVVCDNLDAVVRNIQREPIAAWFYFSLPTNSISAL